MAAWSVPDNLVFLALGKEALPLLKRGVVPLSLATQAGLVWYQARSSKKKPATARVSELEYFTHLSQEYARLPDNLKSLFTEEAFIQQAEPKRADIEAALFALRQQQSNLQIGQPEDWLLQRFFTQPYSTLAWQQTGFNKLWLGIDTTQWSQVQTDTTSVSAVRYVTTQPASYPERLLADSSENAALAEQRLVMPRTEVDSSIMLNDKQQGLLRLPPKALRCVLMGAATSKQFRQSFVSYWRQDFRYQRIPVALMQLQADQFAWQFHLLEFTKAENP